ncbi:hypothetical protein KSS87_001084 [Heliosperma pusillum]|nr:hypothetical protein KSS87_001084 [Heliosperma pusillum]
MALAEGGESPSSAASCSTRHFYLAVDRLPFKMETLVDLLGVVGRRSGLPIVVCCSSRDELDAYSDLGETERALVLERFRHAALKWHQSSSMSGEVLETGELEIKSPMVVVTDVCLPIIASGESPLPARVLINYELPAKKEIYMRRMAACLSSDGIVINMVVGGEVVTLKSIEESSNLIVAEMPIQAS